MSRLNARRKTSFITSAGEPGSRRASRPEAGSSRAGIDVPKRRHPNIRHLEQTVHVAGYEGSRQIASRAWDTTSRRPDQQRDRLTDHDALHQRNGIEDALGSGVNFFHLDWRERGPAQRRPDVALTCRQRLLPLAGEPTRRVPRFEAQTALPEDRRDRGHCPRDRGPDPRPLRETGAQPDLATSRARHQSGTNPMGRRKNAPIHIREYDLTKPKKCESISLRENRR